MHSKQRSHLTVTGVPEGSLDCTSSHSSNLLPIYCCRWCELLEGIQPQYMTSAEPPHQLTLVVLSKPYKSHLIYAYSSIWRKIDIIKIKWRRKGWYKHHYYGHVYLKLRTLMWLACVDALISAVSVPLFQLWSPRKLSWLCSMYFHWVFLAAPFFYCGFKYHLIQSAQGTMEH